MIEWSAMAAIAVVVLLLIDRAMRRAEDRILNERDEPMPSRPGTPPASPRVMASRERGRDVAA
jgi:hypothetical protein